MILISLFAAAMGVTLGLWNFNGSFLDSLNIGCGVLSFGIFLMYLNGAM